VDIDRNGARVVGRPSTTRFIQVVCDRGCGRYRWMRQNREHSPVCLGGRAVEIEIEIKF
jgi:hypothetical protein